MLLGKKSYFFKNKNKNKIGIINVTLEVKEVFVEKFFFFLKIIKKECLTKLQSHAYTLFISKTSPTSYKLLRGFLGL